MDGKSLVLSHTSKMMTSLDEPDSLHIFILALMLAWAKTGVLNFGTSYQTARRFDTLGKSSGCSVHLIPHWKHYGLLLG